MLPKLQEAPDQLTEAVRCAEKTQDHVQKLEIENVKLQTTVKKQVGKIEQLQKNLLRTRSSEDEKEQLKKYIELKQSLENSLDQEKKKNSEFKKEITGFKFSGFNKQHWFRSKSTLRKRWPGHLASHPLSFRYKQLSGELRAVTREE
ncbi:ankyrin repeat domain-containing protein 26-like [Bubalus kerabau]|uniref:ankyrin repeat domain-containing protein 26-like n=1 Tax=Bubalus carabanensis TaxID=3119969 RepID=UPI00244EDAF6|nr:ankyrin repeat domain-containing protein 26-like [Bubalus carabanensis]